MVSHFPGKVCNGVEDLLETLMTPSNFRSSAMVTPNLAVKDNFDFSLPEPVYVYTDITKPNLVGDSYVRLMTSFALAIGYRLP